MSVFIIIYNYFTGKLREFWFTKGFQREPMVKSNFEFPEKVVVHNFIV